MEWMMVMLLAGIVIYIGGRWMAGFVDNTVVPFVDGLVRNRKDPKQTEPIPSAEEVDTP